MFSEEEDVATVSDQKSMVALGSVGAAIGLTMMKLIVGVITGSLGLLAEAAHSGLDLVAALLTFFAVRFADRPADASHNYGHGKVENLSAFIEAGLLLLTAVWVIYEAIRRLIFHDATIAISLWAFVVMAISIVVDFTRSRMLMRVALRVGSQALEADALHFSTDIWSSSVVIVGLAIVALATQFGLPSWLKEADAVAALGVSGIVIFVSLKLARETIDALLDRAPEQIVAAVRRPVGQLEHVLDLRRVRLRRAGNKFFADIVVAAPRTHTFEQTHTLTEAIESATRLAVRASAPQADIDVVVHIEPTMAANETVRERIHYLAEEHGVHAHDIHVREVGGRYEAVFDLEVPPHLDLRSADAIAARLEVALLANDSRLARVDLHLEAPEVAVLPLVDVTDDHQATVRMIRAIAAVAAGAGEVRAIRLYRGTPTDHGEGVAVSGAVDVIIYLAFAGDVPLDIAHTQAEAVKRQLRQRFPNLETITVRTEPFDIRADLSPS